MATADGSARCRGRPRRRPFVARVAGLVSPTRNGRNPSPSFPAIGYCWATPVANADTASPSDSASTAPLPPTDTARLHGVARSRGGDEARRVLIASLDNETGDSSLANLGVLAADWIAQGVRQTGMVNVVDPTSTLAAMRRRAADTTGALTGFPRAALMARDADADIVVWGAVNRQADSLVFRARVSDVRRGTCGDNGSNRVAALESDARSHTPARARRGRARGVVRSSLRVGRAPVESDADLRGLLRVHGRARVVSTVPDAGEARRHFAAAFALDTTFATPLVWSALSFDTDGNPRGRDSVARILAERRDRGQLEGFALDYFRAEQYKDRAAMLIAARGAARLTPGSNWSHYAGSLALSQNRLREASHWFAQIDPERGWVQGWPPFWESYMTTSHLLGEFDTEAALARRGLALGADDMSVRLHSLFSLIGRGRVDEANAALEDVVRAMSAFNQNNVVSWLGRCSSKSLWSFVPTVSPKTPRRRSIGRNAGFDRRRRKTSSARAATAPACESSSGARTPRRSMKRDSTTSRRRCSRRSSPPIPKRASITGVSSRRAAAIARWPKRRWRRWIR